MIEYFVELVGKLAKAAGSRGLQFTQPAVLLELFFVKIDVAGHREVVVQAHADIAPAMFAENGIAVGIDVLGVLEPQLQHGRDRMLQAVGADEMTCLGNLLNGQERRVDGA